MGITTQIKTEVIMLKWDFFKKEYTEFVPNSKGVYKTYCSNMNERVNCAHCGKRLKFKDSYTSLQIQDHIGMGFAVCKECYKDESRGMWEADAERQK
jgi:hypothetical protein